MRFRVISTSIFYPSVPIGMQWKAVGCSTTAPPNLPHLACYTPMSPEWVKKQLEKVTEKDLWSYKLAIGETWLNCWPKWFLWCGITGMPEEIAQHSFFSAQNRYSWVNVNRYELYIRELIGQSGKVAAWVTWLYSETNLLILPIYSFPASVLNEATSGSVKAEKVCISFYSTMFHFRWHVPVVFLYN